MRFITVKISVVRNDRQNPLKVFPFGSIDFRIKNPSSRNRSRGGHAFPALVVWFPINAQSLILIRYIRVIGHDMRKKGFNSTLKRKTLGKIFNFFYFLFNFLINFHKSIFFILIILYNIIF